MRTLYLDCQMGCAGDMFAGALFDLLSKDEQIECLDYLRTLGIPNVAFSAKKVVDCGVKGTSFNVIINGDLQEGPGGAILQSPTLALRNGRPMQDENGVSTGQVGRHHLDDREHDVSTPKEIAEIIMSLGLNSSVESDALAIFALLARAEAQAHGSDVEHVHFHEVGAMDAIADVVASSVLMWLVNPALVLSSAINIGSGTVRCEHGELPVPTPAVSHLLRTVPVYSGSINGEVIEKELCTPTGAAILRHFVNEFTPMPQMRVFSTGNGFGHLRFDAPNCLRAFIGELSMQNNIGPVEQPIVSVKIEEEKPTPRPEPIPYLQADKQENQANHQQKPAQIVNQLTFDIAPQPTTWANAFSSASDMTDTIVEMACNIDDMSPEDLGFAFEALSDADETLDVYMQAIQMKKSRPATMLTVLVRPNDVEKIAKMIFELTTTIGIRTTQMNRLILDRQVDVRDTPLGKLRVKVSEGYGVKKEKPEFDDVALAFQQIQESE